MPRHRVHESPNLIYSPGTQVVALAGGGDAPAGAVGVILSAPSDRQHAYRVQFSDSWEGAYLHNELTPLAAFKLGEIADVDQTLTRYGLFDRVIYRCVIGSRAYGLETPESDTDRRGVYVPPAELHWSLYGVPEQLENEATQEAYWELQKFIVMALKANPNVLECLYSPLVETATPLARELLSMRDCFLSKIVYQTYNGYVMSQFKKLQGDLRNRGQVKWKHVMHLIRLLLAGIQVLREGTVCVRVGEHRAALLEIKAGKRAWPEINEWRLALHAQFDEAYRITTLPDKPDYQRANAFLIDARRRALAEELP
jgi:predicted nucleotidyltransferase